MTAHEVAEFMAIVLSVCSIVSTVLSARLFVRSIRDLRLVWSGRAGYDHREVGRSAAMVGDPNNPL